MIYSLVNYTFRQMFEIILSHFKFEMVTSYSRDYLNNELLKINQTFFIN